MTYGQVNSYNRSALLHSHQRLSVRIMLFQPTDRAFLQTVPHPIS